MPKQKPTIAIDVDDTLAEFAQSFCEFHNHKYHTNTNPNTVTSYNAQLNTNCTPDQFMQRVYEFYNSSLFNSIRPVPGAVQAVTKLKKDFNLIIVTSRPTEVSKPTNQWIETHFPNTFSEVFLTNQFSRKPQHHTTKATICKKHHASYLIDDALDYAKSCHQVCQVLLYNRSWNQTDHLPDNTHRVYNWQQVTDIILAKS